ncbi:uncharacterized protein BO97DRAFT_356656 [Aspergillus homomorphus CBS 101889]|uniref:CYTH domain-containing protein n=1 Tax=Aspergillus homomorphus (strain CBS 101889) TaxID=1450537 RepID=A0A395HM57_ASPHC|nr:hypothetical protein BO97DRAFT_356656 [Aspergillus homomorphus CBS 101889]RAL07354.1 hypothetical protein BO97DRAFT_356656 [Aspergillus homomorphus CBS 101889]
MASDIIPRQITDTNMVPDYEVKLRLDPAKVLDIDQGLTRDVKSAFDVLSTVTKLNVQFLDMKCKEIYTAGWSPRIRKTENKNDIELTYKRRYAITDGGIDAVLTTANQDGFHTGNTEFKAQVEWGYQKQTLSISHKDKVNNSGNSGMGLPGTSESRQILINKAPDKFDNWKYPEWGTSTLFVSRIFGPVLARRFTGNWNELELHLEVWPLVNSEGTGIEHIVEASFKTENRGTASRERRNLVNFLSLPERNWFLSQDSLKTQLIMERY